MVLLAVSTGLRCCDIVALRLACLHEGGAAVNNTFTSDFATHIEALLEWRTSLGHSLRDMRNAMAGFDRICSSHHPSETVLTRELATTWCSNTSRGHLGPRPGRRWM